MKETDTYGLRKVFPENADMPGSVEAAAAEGAGDTPRNNVATDIRQAAVAADNQRLQGHPPRPRCQAARLPHRTLDSHSIAWKKRFFLRKRSLYPSGEVARGEYTGVRGDDDVTRARRVRG